MKRSLSKSALTILTLNLFVLSFAACSPKKDTKPEKSEVALSPFAMRTDGIAIMQFNVENMFDTLHDEGTDDETYLPKAFKDSSAEVQEKCNVMTNTFYKDECLNLDWSEKVVDAKLSNVSKTILSVENGRGADIILMEEVENKNILTQLRDKHLKPAGYQTAVLIEGFDTRGIDVALMSRLPLRGEPVLHRIPFVANDPKDEAGQKKSRGILEVPLTLPDGSPLTAFVVHFPSQSNPRYWRGQAVDFLKTLISAHKNELVIAGGDFNISSPEDKVTNWYGGSLSEVGLVSHKVGCKGCAGTSYYKGTYDFLDAIIFGGDFMDGKGAWVLDRESIEVVRRNPGHLTADGHPLRFDPVKLIGVSDHLPTLSKIYPNK